MYNSTLTPRSKQKAIHMDFQLWNLAEIGFACQILSWSTTDCSQSTSFHLENKGSFSALNGEKIQPLKIQAPLFAWVLFDNLGWALFTPLLPSLLSCLELAAICQGAVSGYLTQIQSPSWITSGVEQRWQIIHLLLKLTLASFCFPCMLYSQCVCMFCFVFSAVTSARDINYSAHREKVVT